MLGWASDYALALQHAELDEEFDKKLLVYVVLPATTKTESSANPWAIAQIKRYTRVEEAHRRRVTNECMTRQSLEGFSRLMY